MDRANLRALIVEDEFLIAEGYRTLLELLGVAVCGIAQSADDALSLAIAHRPRLVLMDVGLRGQRDGIDAASDIRDRTDARIIYITGSREPEVAERIARDPESAFLLKPVGTYQLREAVAQLAG